MIQQNGPCVEPFARRILAEDSVWSAAKSSPVFVENIALQDAVIDALVCLRLVDVQSLCQPAELLPAETPHLGHGSRPLKPAAVLHALVQQHKAVAFPQQRFDPVAPPSAEQKQAV